MELWKSTFVFEQHLQKTASALQHFVQSVVQTDFESALLRYLLLVTILVLSVPNIMSDKLLDLKGLVRGKAIFGDLVRGESVHQTRDVLYQDIITSDHYF